MAGARFQQVMLPTYSSPGASETSAEANSSGLKLSLCLIVMASSPVAERSQHGLVFPDEGFGFDFPGPCARERAEVEFKTSGCSRSWAKPQRSYGKYFGGSSQPKDPSHTASARLAASVAASFAAPTGILLQQKLGSFWLVQSLRQCSANLASFRKDLRLECGPDKPKVLPKGARVEIPGNLHKYMHIVCLKRHDYTHKQTKLWPKCIHIRLQLKGRSRALQGLIIDIPSWQIRMEGKNLLGFWGLLLRASSKEACQVAWSYRRSRMSATHNQRDWYSRSQQLGTCPSSNPEPKKRGKPV